MGVINITPNSFSDGGQANSLESCAKSIKELLPHSHILDFGAESTAPFNDAIGAEEELKRFSETFYPNLALLKNLEIISIDTYKIYVFESVYLKIRETYPLKEIWFNDISGKLCPEVYKFLAEDKNLKYVWSHNLCPTRVLANNHMEYVSPSSGEKFLHEVVNYFNSSPFTKLGSASERKSTEKFASQIIVDPCFGFSKSRAQNLLLLENVHLLESENLLIGISRKTFLRPDPEMDMKLEQNRKIVDKAQSQIITAILSKSSNKNIYFRMHVPSQLQ